MRCRSLRALIAILLFCGVGFSIGLSAAPQLHEWLHKTERSANHECAATLLASGSWEYSAGEPILTQPHRAAIASSFIKPDCRVIARAESSILEHAPPALS